MIRHQILLSLIIVTAWFPFNGVRAVEVLTAQELALHCKVLSVDRMDSIALAIYKVLLMGRLQPMFAS